MNYVAVNMCSELRRLFKSVLQHNLLHLTDLVNVLGFPDHVMLGVSFVKTFQIICSLCQ